MPLAPLDYWISYRWVTSRDPSFSALTMYFRCIASGPGMLRYDFEAPALSRSAQDGFLIRRQVPHLPA
jgi:hypothetical protein